MVKNLNSLAKKIIKENQYVSIASSDKTNKPWISPVVYSYDNDWNLYFASMITSRHSQNIKENKEVALAIFDSRQLWGQGVGLQIEAQAKKLSLKESIKAGKIYATRKYPFGGINTKVASSFIKSMVFEGKKYGIYKLKLKKVYMNNPNSKFDERIGIKLS